MKIAIHAPRVSYYHGGVERYILNMVLSLQKINKNIYLITYDSPKKTKWFKEFRKKFKGEIILFKSKEIDRNFHKFENATKPSLWDLESKLFSKVSRKYYRENNFNIISLHYTLDCFGIPNNNKICLHLHGAPSKLRDVDKQAIKIPQKIIAVSKYVLDGWKNAISKNKNVFVVHNGITELKLRKTKKTNDILFFGRLIKTKGADILIKAIKENINLFEEIKVKIVGEGPEKKRLKKLIRDLNLNKNIKLLGYIGDSQLYKLINESKISVFPSYAKEGVMTTLLESAMLKSAILVSKSCSNKEFIKDNYNGLFFKQKDVKDLSNKIRLLLANQKLQNKLTKNCKQIVKEWTWQNQVKKILKTYKK